MTSETILAGSRVLVVEDEALIALDISDLLAEAGVVVIGPLSSLGDALAEAPTVEVDAALLDVSLARREVWPVAEILLQRRIPIIFLTGYASLALPEQFAVCPRMDKPVDATKLRAQLTETLRRVRSAN